MYRPSLAVAAVVLVLTLVGTTGAQNNGGSGLPQQICKLQATKAKCQDLKAKGRCTKESVFKTCQKVCDPRCQLGTPKPKCADTESASFCRQRKSANRCSERETRDKCKKTCGRCQACDNRIEDGVCDLVSSLGWCKAPRLFELCRETCDRKCKQPTCDDCNDMCVRNAAVTKSCGARGVCLIDDIVPCDDKCDGDKKVVKRKCEDGKCVRRGVKPCTDKCYGNTLVSVNCEKGKCKYGTSKRCPCGCDKSGTACKDASTCCKKTCKPNDVLQDPNSKQCRCRECINDQTGITRDTGCTNRMPLCGAPPKQYGDQCFMCQNDKKEGRRPDTGCGGNRPNCRANPGEYGRECFGTVCKLRDIDVCIAVDGSGSLGTNEFAVERKFVTDLVSAFAAVPKATVRWGGNQFGTGVTDIIPGFTSVGSDFTKAVNRMSQVGGNTNTGEAILNCSAKLTGAASTSNKKLFILITDGANNSGYTDSRVQGFATDLKRSAQIFTVGAGTDGSTDAFLEDVATDDSVFFEASSVTAINDVLQEIITRLCETTEI